MRDFKDLKLWEKAHRLTLAVYKATLVFPKEELYGLTSQIRRASTSIPANIAERCGRSGEAELARFLQIGDGICPVSSNTNFILAHELDLLRAANADRINSEAEN